MKDKKHRQRERGGGGERERERRGGRARVKLLYSNINTTTNARLYYKKDNCKDDITSRRSEPTHSKEV